MKFFMGIVVGVALTLLALCRVDVITIRANLPAEKRSLGRKLYDLWEGSPHQPEQETRP